MSPQALLRSTEFIMVGLLFFSMHRKLLVTTRSREHGMFEVSPRIVLIKTERNKSCSTKVAPNNQRLKQTEGSPDISTNICLG